MQVCEGDCQWDGGPGGETWGSRVDGRKFAYSGGMVRVEFEGYGALGGNE